MADKIHSLDAMRSEVDFLLTLFIDYSDEKPDISAAATRCASFYLHAIVPTTEADHLILTAF
jgi:hypothetical protein